MKIFNQNAELLAILDNIISPQISEEINGEYSLSFTTVIEEEKSQYINHNNYVEIENDYFQIVKFKKIRNSNNELIIDTLAQHKSYELTDHEINEFVYSGTPTQLLNYLLTNTPYTLLSCNIATIISVEIREKTNKRAILMEIAKAAAGELEFNKYNISLLQQRGQNRGTQLRVGKNLNGISVEVDNTQKVLGQPSIAYDVNMVELNELEDFKGYEVIAIGDTVKVIDEDLGINTDLRIKRYAYNPLDRIESNVNLSNVVKDITDITVKIQRSAVFKEVAYNGNVISPEVGFQSTRSDLKSRTTMSGTDGFKLEKGDGNGGYGTVFSVDSNGDVIANDITANNMIANEMKTSNTVNYLKFYSQFIECINNGVSKVKLGFSADGGSPLPILILGRVEGGYGSWIFYNEDTNKLEIGVINGNGLTITETQVIYNGSEIATLDDLSNYVTSSTFNDTISNFNGALSILEGRISALESA